jgi:LemA protein
MTLEWILGVLGLIVLAVVLYGISIHNTFARLSAHLRESWANVDVALRRRHDLIPNLVETVKGYAQHERQTMETLLELRSRAETIQSPAELAREESRITGGIHRLFALAEGYPELRSGEQFRQLQQELVDTEDRIAAARRFYNSNVREFNTYLESFPPSLLAGNRRPAEFFEIDDPVPRIAPPVDLRS